MQLKSIFRNFIRSFGLDFCRPSPASNPSVQLLAALNHVQADTVFDIGANIGQFARKLRSVGHAGDIISFEPFSNEHEILSKVAKFDPAW